jgi:hypothetical protein
LVDPVKLDSIGNPRPFLTARTAALLAILFAAIVAAFG